MVLQPEIEPTRGRELRAAETTARWDRSPVSDELLFRSGDPHLMLSLVRGLHVLEAFSCARQPATLASLSAATGLSRAVVRRCVYTLRELGYIQADGPVYQLTSKVLAVGRPSEPVSSMDRAAQSALEELRGKLGGSCSVGVLDEGMVLYIARAGASHGPGPRTAAGSRAPAYCTALGRVLLSSLTDEHAAAELSKVAILPLTPFTVISRRSLWEILVKVRTDGYALSDQELKTGVRTVAVPVLNRVGSVVAAMSVSAVASRTTSAEMAQDFLPVLKTAAVRLGRQWPGGLTGWHLAFNSR